MSYSFYQNPVKVQQTYYYNVKFIMDISPRHCIEAPVVLILCKAIQIDYQSETTSTKEHASEINLNWTTRHDSHRIYFYVVKLQHFINCRHRDQTLLE